MTIHRTCHFSVHHLKDSAIHQACQCECWRVDSPASAALHLPLLSVLGWRVILYRGWRWPRLRVAAIVMLATELLAYHDGGGSSPTLADSLQLAASHSCCQRACIARCPHAMQR